MTTREIYFKNVYLANGLPMGMVGYIIKDKNGVMQIGSSIHLELRTKGDAVEKSINEMKEVEKTDGFMFWVHSPDGEEFLKNNRKHISNAFIRTFLNQNKDE